MSWFIHKRKVKEPSKLKPYHTSPMAEKFMKETKESVRSSDHKKTPKKD
jgi:hypothetical protein